MPVNSRMPEYVGCIFPSKEDGCSTTTRNNVEEFPRHEMEKKKLPIDLNCRTYKSRLNCVWGAVTGRRPGVKRLNAGFAHEFSWKRSELYLSDTCTFQ